MKQENCKFVLQRDICQMNKAKNIAYLGLLQPLPIPEQIWSNIFIDFIERLSKSHGKEVIMMIMDRLSKYAHFLTLTHLYTTKYVAQLFKDNIYKLYDLPRTIVSDINRIFTTHFQQHLLILQGTQ